MSRTVTYQVRGSWPFPTDMLRYDASEPATPEDAALVKTLEVDNLNEAAEGMHTVTLHRVAAPRYWRPTERRWESFCWRVVK